MNPQEKKDLDKYLRFLCYKAVQVIVQARQGEKFHTKSSPLPSGSDWFNICLGDNGWAEISSEAKRAMGGQLPTVECPLCVELSLKHVDGSTMGLEVWCISVADVPDLSARPNYTVYNKMAVLIKSLLTLSRVTPAYRLSRRQGADHYVILYQVYLGDPQVKNLGEGYETAKVGQVGTPIGTVIMRMNYRTDLTFSPDSSQANTPVTLKHDHFHQPQYHNSPKQQQTQKKTNHIKPHKVKPIKTTEELIESKQIGAFAEESEDKSDFLIPDTRLLELSEETSKVENSSEKPVEEQKEKQEENKSLSSSSSSVPEDFVLVELKTPFGVGEDDADLSSFYRSWQSAPPLTSFVDPTLEDQLDAVKLQQQIDSFQNTQKEFEKLLHTICKDETEQV